MGTRAEKRAEKESHLHGEQSRFEALLTDYFLTQGYFLLGKDVRHCTDAVVEPVRPIVTEFYKIQRTLTKGGALTQKRREDSAHCFNQLEALVATLDKSNSIVEEYKAHSSRVVAFVLFSILGGLFLLLGLLYRPALIGAAVLLPIAAFAYVTSSGLKRKLDAAAIREIPVISDDAPGRPQLTRVYYAIYDATGAEPFKVRQDGTGQSYFYADPVGVTCTCSDFIEHRAKFEPREVQRLCVHLAKAFYKLGLWPPQEEIVEALMAYGPLGGGSWSYKSIYRYQLRSGADVFFGSTKGKAWIDVYARRRRAGERGGIFSGPYARYSFSTVDKRWSYGKAPPGAGEIKRVMDILF